MGHFVHGQRHEHDGNGDRNENEVWRLIHGVPQGPGRTRERSSVRQKRRAIKAQAGQRCDREMRQHGVRRTWRRRRAPGPPASRDGPRRGCRTRSAAPCRFLGPIPAIPSSSDRRSRFVRDARWNVTANRCASSRMRRISSRLGLSSRSAIGVFAIAREQQLFLLRDTDRHEVAEAEALAGRGRPPTAGPCRRRSESDPETVRRSRAACDTAASRPRASRRSRRGAVRTGCGGGPDPEPRILNFRYSDFFMRPSSQTTIDATVSLPWMVEMSKHSMRRGTADRPSTARSVSRAS